MDAYGLKIVRISLLTAMSLVAMARYVGKYIIIIIRLETRGVVFIKKCCVCCL